METDDLIRRLSDEAPPVRRLARPWLRALLWLAVGLPIVVLVIFVVEPHGKFAMAITDARSIVEAVAILATAVAAAIAAFASEVPGADRRWLWLPLIPLAVWLALLGQGCASDYAVMGAAAFSLHADGCLQPAILAGIVPAVLIFAMIMRGAPVMPRVTLALSALAVSALVNFGLMLLHVGDVSIMVLVWHGGAMALIAALVAFAGPGVFRWRHARPA